MADSSLEAVGPHPAIAQPTVNVTGGMGPDVAVAEDRKLNLPFEKYPPPPTPPPAPPPLSEAERRERLADALKVQAQAAEAMQRATEAHERALRHVSRCQTAVANYAGLGTEIDAFTLWALRDNGKAELPEVMRRRIGERDIAQAELVAAERAVTALLQERSAATTRHQKSEWAITEALGAVIDVAKDGLRPELHRLRQKIAAVEQLLRRGATATVWASVAERLKLDPLNGSLDIEVPDEPIPDPPPVAFHFVDEVIDAQTGEKMTLAQRAALEHRRRVESQTPETYYQQIENARAAQAALASGGGVGPVRLP